MNTDETLTMQIMDNIIAFQRDSNDDTFVDVFGESEGIRLWNRFHGYYDHKLLTLYAYLDTDDRQVLVDYINSKYLR